MGFLDPSIQTPENFLGLVYALPLLNFLMPVANLPMPSRLLAGGGPGAPDPRVLRAMSAPLIGQFDPDFTAIMDDVMELARGAFLTRNERCFPVSGLAVAGLEAVLNTLIEPGAPVAIGGGARFVAETADIARRYGAEVVPWSEAKLIVVPLVDPDSRRCCENLAELATAAHAQGAVLIVEATRALGICEVRVDDWGLDACVAGVDYGLGAPSGMALVTYAARVEAVMRARTTPPKTSYLDLLQLQAYWSPERLNHHTAPTSLVYGLREALRLLLHEGLPDSWARHRRVGQALRGGLAALGLEFGGDPPYAVVTVPADQAEARARRTLLEQFGVQVQLLAPHTWGVGLVGADARLDAAMHVLSAVASVLHGSGAVNAARDAYGAA